MQLKDNREVYSHTEGILKRMGTTVQTNLEVTRFSHDKIETCTDAHQTNRDICMTKKHILMIAHFIDLFKHYFTKMIEKTITINLMSER